MLPNKKIVNFNLKRKKEQNGIWEWKDRRLTDWSTSSYRARCSVNGYYN